MAEHVADEVVTHQQVLDGLSRDVQRTLLMALPPEQRGWWTEAEIEGKPGNWICVTQLCDTEDHFIPGRQ